MSYLKTGNKRRIDRLLIVSNRLPIGLFKDEIGNWQVKASTGGLITALTPILGNMNGLWIGWSGTLEEVDPHEVRTLGGKETGLELKAINLTEDEITQYYYGFSNKIIWPLFHDLQTHCDFDPDYWHAYQTVNRKFAEVVAENIRANDYTWIHDYHLMLIARELHALGINDKLGFFLHVPFPPLDIFLKLPWRIQILEALLHYDLLGFQTARDRNNFIHCVEAFNIDLHHDARRQVSTLTLPDRKIQAGIFPISIDFNDFAQQARSKEVNKEVQKIHKALPNRQIILGVDRLDYSKGIPQKMLAIKNLLDRFPDLRGKVTLIQVVVPSREDIPQYQQQKSEVEGLVSEINGEFTRTGWIPVHYVFRSLTRTELLAYYRAADMSLVTSLKDGMNLVSKEYCAARIDNTGVLILSEFAGSASHLRRNALLINPYDMEGVANAIHQAYNMSKNERQSRMRKLRERIRTHDIFWWADAFLSSATADMTNESPMV